jgi:hypothetical protein
MHNTETKSEKATKKSKKALKTRENYPEIIEIDTDLSEKELKVLELYFSGAPLHKAVKAAGYKAKDIPTRVFIGNRILQKYECQAGGKGNLSAHRPRGGAHRLEAPGPDRR